MNQTWIKRSLYHNTGNVCLWVRGVLEATVHLEGEHLQGGVMKLKYFLQIKNIFSSTRWCGATSCCTSSSTPPSPSPTDTSSLMSRRWPRFIRIGITDLSSHSLNIFQTIFENIVIHCQTFADLIPVTFVLGFYVSIILARSEYVHNLNLNILKIV